VEVRGGNPESSSRAEGGRDEAAFCCRMGICPTPCVGHVSAFFFFSGKLRHMRERW